MPSAYPIGSVAIQVVLVGHEPPSVPTLVAGARELDRRDVGAQLESGLEPRAAGSSFIGSQP